MMARRLLGLGGAAGIGLAATSALDVDGPAAGWLYKTVFMPTVRLLDAESAHRFAVLAARFGLTPRQRQPDAQVLNTKLWGRSIANPIGLAAGFDKDAEAVDGMLGIGFGFVEVGSVTPKPQPGNPKPRVFRLPEDRAVINRYGFNSAGHSAAAANLSGSTRLNGKCGNHLVGVNLGKNKLATDAVADYVEGVRALGPLSDYLVVNVSSPNTPGLRALQQKDELVLLLRGVRQAVDALGAPSPPLVLKIAPDLTEQQRADIADVALSEGVDGLIISNTTIGRVGLTSPSKIEEGGLSGAPLFELSTQVLSDLYRRTGGKITLIGVGGVSSGKEAYAKIRAGASAVQLYTALIYEGPPLVSRIKRELAELLEADGFISVDQAVGVDVPLR